MVAAVGFPPKNHRGFVVTSRDHRVKKLLQIYWEIVEKTKVQHVQNVQNEGWGEQKAPRQAVAWGRTNDKPSDLLGTPLSNMINVICMNIV